MVQKEFYGSFESRKLSFFAIQMGAGLFDWVLDHSGKRTPLYHLSELQTVEIVPAVIETGSAHSRQPQLCDRSVVPHALS